MKKFKANPIINVPRWLETITHCILFLLFLLIAKYIGLDARIEKMDILIFTGSNYSSVLLIFFVFYSFKLLGNSSAIDSLEIDNENKNITVVYWPFYVFKRKLTIEFEELSYQNRNEMPIVGGFSLRIYQNEKYKIKLNSRNGWKNKQIDEITSEFLMIKPPLKIIIRRLPWV